uniref:Uncharacterized protein n=1 Tax=Tetraselmis sp. GSL018 TaxID=582737 RepID=A0A061R5M8_9CHLO
MRGRRAAQPLEAPAGLPRGMPRRARVRGGGLRPARAADVPALQPLPEGAGGAELGRPDQGAAAAGRGQARPVWEERAEDLQRAAVPAAHVLRPQQRVAAGALRRRVRARVRARLPVRRLRVQRGQVLLLRALPRVLHGAGRGARRPARRVCGRRRPRVTRGERAGGELSEGSASAPCPPRLMPAGALLRTLSARLLGCLRRPSQRSWRRGGGLRL